MAFIIRNRLKQEADEREEELQDNVHFKGIQRNLRRTKRPTGLSVRIETQLEQLDGALLSTTSTRFVFQRTKICFGELGNSFPLFQALGRSRSEFPIDNSTSNAWAGSQLVHLASYWRYQTEALHLLNNEEMNENLWNHRLFVSYMLRKSNTHELITCRRSGQILSLPVPCSPEQNSSGPWTQTRIEFVFFHAKDPI